MQLSLNVKALSVVFAPVVILVIGGVVATWYAATNVKPVRPFPIDAWSFNSYGLTSLAVYVSCPRNQVRLSLDDAAMFAYDPFAVDIVPVIDQDKMYPQELSESVTLNIIIKTGADFACRINNEFYREGQMGAFFSVKKITCQGVWLETGDGEVFLRTGQTQNIVAKTMASSER